uniref:Polyketide synthase PksR n=1 Tax=Talaromyces marneffei PM1 TaxID=1077442 RepID=A0A093UN74_TALMA
MFGDNPVIIQQERFQASSVPLFLIHDGGGTITSYHSFGDLGRDLYGIYNPRFQDNEKWTSGIVEMAQEYVEMIKSISPANRIMLGGWSLGGLIALEMSHILANDLIINVVGLIMIDIVYPPAISAANLNPDVRDINLSRDIPVKQRQRMMKLIKEATASAKAYELPTWTSGSESDSSMDSISMPSPPPTVLLRAKDPVPSRRGTKIPNMLGWDSYEADLVKEVYEIPGHHFSIFDSVNIDQFTTSLRETCTLLENGIIV